MDAQATLQRGLQRDGQGYNQSSGAAGSRAPGSVAVSWGAGTVAGATLGLATGMFMALRIARLHRT